MTASRVTQLLDAAHWLRLSGDEEGARKLYQQVLQLEPYNMTAADFLSGKNLTLTPLPQERNPFQRVDPEPGPQSEGNPLELDWGMWASGETPSRPPPQAPLPVPTVPVVPAEGLELAWEEPVAPELPASQRSTVAFAGGQEDAWNQDPSSAPLELDVEVASSGGDPLDLVAESALLTSPAVPEPESEADAPEELSSLLQGVRDLVELDDHSGAMDLLLKAESIAPEHSQIRQLKLKSETALLSMFDSRIGDVRATPRVVLKEDEIIWLNLDHRAGFVLAQIDGSVTFEDLFAVSGMSRFDTARILAQLVDEGVISA